MKDYFYELTKWKRFSYVYIKDQNKSIFKIWFFFFFRINDDTKYFRIEKQTIFLFFFFIFAVFFNYEFNLIKMNGKLRIINQFLMKFIITWKHFLFHFEWLHRRFVVFHLIDGTPHNKFSLCQSNQSKNNWNAHLQNDFQIFN